jgi:hypothetical protein
MAYDNLEQNFRDDIVKEIDIRLDALYKTLGGNNNAGDFKRLSEILRNYTDKDATELTAFDIKGMTDSDYQEILTIIGVPAQSTSLMLRQYKVYSKSLDDRNSPQEFNEALDYLNLISTKVCEYANEFRTISAGREDYAKNESDKLIALKQILQDETNSVILNLDEIDNTLGDLGITTKQRWQVLELVADHNVKSLPGRVADLETYKKVSEAQKYVNKYLEFAELVKDYINKNGIDVDTVPLTSEKICALYEIPNKNIVTNIVVGVVSGAYYKEYQERLATIDPFAEDVKRDINRLCSFIVSDQRIKLDNAELIVKNKYNQIIEAINNEEDIFSYSDIYLSDYTDEESYEQAKAKKCLPIVYSLAQTLDTYNSERTGVKEKAEAMQMINSLVDANNDIEDKRFTPNLMRAA